MKRALNSTRRGSDAAVASTASQGENAPASTFNAHARITGGSRRWRAGQSQADAAVPVLRPRSFAVPSNFQRPRFQPAPIRPASIHGSSGRLGVQSGAASRVYGGIPLRGAFLLPGLHCSLWRP